jgi:hypothetical protein
MYFGSHELSDLLEKLGKTHEEAAEILEKVIPTPSHYRLLLSLNDEQEKHARRTFTSLGNLLSLPSLSMGRQARTIFGRLLLKIWCRMTVLSVHGADVRMI